VAARPTVGTFAARAARRIFAHGASSAAGSTPAASDAEKGEANDFYLRGRYEWNQRTPESLNRALDLFTQAIVRDPGDARAYAGLWPVSLGLKYRCWFKMRLYSDSDSSAGDV
jgi:hypothetical protein